MTTPELPPTEADGFGLDHLPYGVFSPDPAAPDPRPGIRYGRQVLDLRATARELRLPWATNLVGPTLNPLIGAGPTAWAELRARVQALFSDERELQRLAPLMHDVDQVLLHRPVDVPDYVDFYASEHHATKVGSLFRPDGDPLTPNWKHLPIGYHGRSSTIVVSGRPVVRPVGQRRPADGTSPPFGPSEKLDLEAELGFIVGGATEPGTPVPIDQAEEHLFGVALFNDWSARDIQAWEYVPLGPFLGKSFASSMSAWITPMAALEPAKVALPAQEPTPLPYLRRGDGADHGLDIELVVELNGTVVARPNYRDMYWSPAQMLAHLTVNGAALSEGEVFASGTISGPEADQRGCLLEMTSNGATPLQLDDGSTRTFLDDGDEVVISATAPDRGGGRLMLGEVRGRIVPARS